MNRFNDRYSKLIYHLFYEDSWCSLNELSNKTGFSKSTLWRDLVLMDSSLPSQWKIEKSETHGVRLVKPQNGTLEELWLYFKRENPYFQTLRMIITNNGVTMNDITQQIHVSRSTIYRQLEKIEGVIKKSGVNLSHSPFKLVGDEKNIRRLIMQYVEYMAGELSEFIISFDIKEFQETLLNILKEHQTTLHLGAIQKLAIILHISNMRISHGCYVDFPKNTIVEYEHSKEYEIAKKLFKFMTKCPSREKQIQEILFLSLYIKSEELPLSRTEELRYIRSTFQLESGKPFEAILSKLSKQLGFDISQDEKFLYKFAQTVRGINDDDNLKTDTRINIILGFVPYFESNPLFVLIKRIAEECFNQQTIKLEDIEVLEIFMLVQSVIIRKKKQLRIETALLCRSHVEEDSISEILEYHFGDMLKIVVMDFSDVDLLYRKNGFDLLITTDLGQLITIEHIPMYKISSVPTPYELKEIKDFINTFFADRYNLHPSMIYPYTYKSYQ